MMTIMTIPNYCYNSIDHKLDTSINTTYSIIQYSHKYNIINYSLLHIIDLIFILFIIIKYRYLELIEKNLVILGLKY